MSGEYYSVPEPTRKELRSERLRINVGPPEQNTEAGLRVGQQLVQRDGGETWSVGAINTVDKGPLSGEKMVQLQDANGNTFNTPLSRLQEILKTEGGAWRLA
ncbi:hypothetical protein HYX70_02115 [Candidatus Saccharibacteria bacterium]|nr:hypothetical protein [Candidatus Saccharibacteria bacterium]